MPAQPAKEACEDHVFRFDLDRAISEQLVESLEKSHRHPLADAQAPREQGIYAIYLENEEAPLYVGKTGVAAIKQAKSRTDIRVRLRQHVGTLAEAPEFKGKPFAVRYLVIPESWRIVQAETALVGKYRPPLNGTGFGNHVPGAGRPGTGRKNDWTRFLEGEVTLQELGNKAVGKPAEEAVE